MSKTIAVSNTKSYIFLSDNAELLFSLPFSTTLLRIQQLLVDVLTVLTKVQAEPVSRLFLMKDCHDVRKGFTEVLVEFVKQLMAMVILKIAIMTIWPKVVIMKSIMAKPMAQERLLIIALQCHPQVNVIRLFGIMYRILPDYN